jgi:ribonucleoside-diphosphate reductase alpha chain
MPLEFVKKRNGTMAEFDSKRVELAMARAFLASHVAIESEELSELTDLVVAELEAIFQEFSPSVEDVQDVVEKHLAEQGYFEVAKSYILYRLAHAKIRQEEQEDRLGEMAAQTLKVVKRDGSVVSFDPKQIAIAIRNVCGTTLKTKEVDQIIELAKLNIYDGMPTSEINQAVLMVLRARIERDPVYAFLSARMLINELYKRVLGVDEFEKGFAKAHVTKFREQIEHGVETERYDRRLLDFDLERLARAMKPERDQLYQILGAQTLYDRYFMRDPNQMHIETPQYFWMRVAMGLSITETDKDEAALLIYETMSQLHYVAATPTNLHAGTPRAQMSACYLNTVEDDLHHIFKVIGDNAQLSKWSGGIGTDWTNIRGTNAIVKSINIGSQGVIPFLKIVDSTTASINRSGKRRGAVCVYLETWHYDIEEFLELRKNTGDERRRTHDTNTANWIPDLFVKRVRANKEWTLFSPEEVPELHHIYGKKFEKKYAEYEKLADEGKIKMFKRVPAVNIWRKMVSMLFETGHPWITFKDVANVRSPQDHVGVIHSSNLCTEITLNTSAEETAVCNLGSINLANHVTGKKVDWNKLAATIHVAIRSLDNVIDLNFYPTKEAKTSNLRHRPVGMGLQGFQDMLYMLGMDFDSQKAVEFSDELMEFISYHAILGSSKLAKEKGTYESYKGSKWDRGIFPVDTVALLEKERGMETGIPKTGKLDWTEVREHVKEHGMRNSNTMAIAPTATNANINGCLPAAEPIYKNIYVKSNFSGEFTVVNRYLVEDLKKLGLWTPDLLEKIKHYDGNIQEVSEIPANLRAKYKETFQIEPKWIIEHAARRGKWIDQSQSTNIFINSESGKLISDAYMLAWERGLKTTYYLRTLAASSIEKSTVDINKKFAATPASAKSPGSIPDGEQ